MTPEQQRIAIAETCGFTALRWLLKRESEAVILSGSHPNNNVSPTLVPDYLNDLNAMHEAEKVLGDKLYNGTWLAKLRMAVEKIEGLSCNLSAHHRATAAQRAEAFLRTLNLWTT